MVFKCQKDSFLKEFVTKVVNIEKTDDNKFKVNFEDTILFPEGGGQPTDYGTIILKSDAGDETFEVSNVIRKGPDAIHFIDGNDISLKVGDEVLQVVNWERRHDHMQQHSGQHLISALFEQEYKYNTKAWWLGAESSYIEIDGKSITEDEKKRIEKMCNERIAQAVPVNVQMYDSADGAGDEVTRASRGLPIDLSGPVRVINIEGVDSNMCCGTHVTNLAQLQVIKLMNIEKTKNKTLVHFLVGNRVINKLESSFQRELNFNSLLKGGPDSHIELLKKLQTSLKISQKTALKTSRALAESIAACIKEHYLVVDNIDRYYSIHRNEGLDIEFANAFFREVEIAPLFYVITLADAVDSKSGLLIMKGCISKIQELAGPMCEILGGKGVQKGDRFQAKVTQLNRIKECEEFLTRHFMLHE